MIIDFHVHAFADNIAEKAIPKLAALGNSKPYTNGTLSGVLSSMKRANIDYSIIANIATNPRQMQAVNNWAIDTNRLPFVQFGSIHPDSDCWESELERLKESNIMGIKLHPDYQEFYVDEEKMFPIYRKIIDLDMVLLFHSGYDIGLPGDVHCTPERFANVLDKVNTSRFVLAHMGAYQRWEDFAKLISGGDFYIDTAFSLCAHMPIDSLKQLITNHGINKVLFATDSPWADQKEYVDYIINNFDTRDQEKMFSENALKLLKLIK